jgi:GNAT superfamily N-acetyltransferase
LTAESAGIALVKAANYIAAEVLRDGTAIRVRAIRPDDKQRLVRHFGSLSAQAVYFRFFGLKHALTPDDLHRLTELDFADHVALAATIGEGNDERFVGVGRYLRGEDRARAEVAFTVLDQYQGRGIGTILLHHLGRIAAEGGVTEFVANVMANNKQMLEVFANSGFPAHESYEDGIVRVRLDIAGAQV